MTSRWQVTLVRLPRPLLLKFELLARTIMLGMTSWDVATFFEDDLAITAAHVDAHLSWSSCRHVPTHISGRRLDEPQAESEPEGAHVQVVFPWEAHRPCDRRVPEDWVVGLMQYEHNPQQHWSHPHRGRDNWKPQADSEMPVRDDSEGDGPARGFKLDSELGGASSTSSRTTSHGGASGRPIVAAADDRFLVSSGISLNSAYLLYQHQGAPFLVTMVQTPPCRIVTVPLAVLFPGLVLPVHTP
jgi:hypothetical protein